MKISVSQEYGDGHDRSTSSYDIRAGTFIDCARTLCYGGGFDVGSVLYEMVESGQTAAEKSGLCKGFEGSPKGKRNYGPCLNRFDVRVTLKYKNTEDEA